MIGIYKITNKLNGKSYIGQSIHCDKRYKEHCRGKNQFIDETIQLEGEENFEFELLEECEKEQLNEREDYYIRKYNTMFPNGYNKKQNCPQNNFQTDKNYVIPLTYEQIKYSGLLNELLINYKLDIENYVEKEEWDDNRRIKEKEERLYKELFLKDSDKAAIFLIQRNIELRKCKAEEEKYKIYLKYIEIYKTLL